MTATRNLQVTVKKGGGLTMKTLEGILAKTDEGGASDGKVSRPLHCLWLDTDTDESAIRYQRNVQRWMRRFPCYSECPELFSRTSFSVIKKNRIGLFLSLRLSRRSLTISLRPQSELSLFHQCGGVELTGIRYTKALDNIRLLRKERTAELKVDRERLKFLKADKDKAERVGYSHLARS
jgi:DNA repair protein RAD50